MTLELQPKAAVTRYQLACLKRENDFLVAKGYEAGAQSSEAPLPTLRDWLGALFSKYGRTPPLLYILEFYWTVGRLTGLRSPRQDTAAEPDQEGPASVKTTLLPIAGAAASQALPRLLIDVTDTAFSIYKTGIQRYVREVARAAFESGQGLPIIIRGGEPFDAYHDRPDSTPLTIQASDTVFLMDSHWDYEPQLLPFLDTARAAGAKIVVMFYDVIPYLYEYTCDTDNVLLFKTWFDYITPRADAIVTCTETVALEIEGLLEAAGRRQAMPPLGWVAAGTSLDRASGPVSEKTKAIFSQARPVFISVGTIEPRKGFPIALDAFEKLWAAGIDASYVIIGKAGWGLGHFEERLRTHPRLNTSLFWLADLSDAELVHAYENATRLIMPSIAEGFGIPLIEAGQFGLSVIASDIPIFREVIKDRDAMYFEACDPSDLSRRIIESLSITPPAKGASLSSSMTWSQCADALMHMVRTAAYQRSGDR